MQIYKLYKNILKKYFYNIYATFYIYKKYNNIKFYKINLFIKFYFNYISTHNIFIYNILYIIYNKKKLK